MKLGVTFSLIDLNCTDLTIWEIDFKENRLQFKDLNISRIQYFGNNVYIVRSKEETYIVKFYYTGFATKRFDLLWPGPDAGVTGNQKVYIGFSNERPKNGKEIHCKKISGIVRKNCKTDSPYEETKIEDKLVVEEELLRTFHVHNLSGIGKETSAVYLVEANDSWYFIYYRADDSLFNLFFS